MDACVRSHLTSAHRTSAHRTSLLGAINEVSSSCHHSCTNLHPRSFQSCRTRTNPHPKVARAAEPIGSVRIIHLVAGRLDQQRVCDCLLFPQPDLVQYFPVANNARYYNYTGNQFPLYKSNHNSRPIKLHPQPTIRPKRYGIGRVKSVPKTQGFPGNSYTGTRHPRNKTLFTIPDHSRCRAGNISSSAYATSREQYFTHRVGGQN